MDGWIGGWVGGWIGRWIGRWMDGWMGGWVGAEWLERCVNSLARLLDVSKLIKTSGHFVEKCLSYSRAFLTSNQETVFRAKQCLLPRGFTGIPVD